MFDAAGLCVEQFFAASLDGTLKMWDTSEPGGGPRSLYLYLSIYLSIYLYVYR